MGNIVWLLPHDLLTYNKYHESIEVPHAHVIHLWSPRMDIYSDKFRSPYVDSLDATHAFSSLSARRYVWCGMLLGFDDLILHLESDKR